MRIIIPPPRIIWVKLIRYAECLAKLPWETLTKWQQLLLKLSDSKWCATLQPAG